MPKGYCRGLGVSLPGVTSCSLSPCFPVYSAVPLKKMAKKTQINLFFFFKAMPRESEFGGLLWETHNSPDGDVAASHKGQQSSRWEVLLASIQHTTIPHGI